MAKDVRLTHAEAARLRRDDTLPGIHVGAMESNVRIACDPKPDKRAHVIGECSDPQPSHVLIDDEAGAVFVPLKEKDEYRRLDADDGIATAPGFGKRLVLREAFSSWPRLKYVLGGAGLLDAEDWPFQRTTRPDLLAYAVTHPEEFMGARAGKLYQAAYYWLDLGIGESAYRYHALRAMIAVIKDPLAIDTTVGDAFHVLFEQKGIGEIKIEAIDALLGREDLGRHWYRLVGAFNSQNNEGAIRKRVFETMANRLKDAERPDKVLLAARFLLSKGDEGLKAQAKEAVLATFAHSKSEEHKFTAVNIARDYGFADELTAAIVAVAENADGQQTADARVGAAAYVLDSNLPWRPEEREKALKAMVDVVLQRNAEAGVRQKALAYLPHWWRSHEHIIEPALEPILDIAEDPKLDGGLRYEAAHLVYKMGYATEQGRAIAAMIEIARQKGGSATPAIRLAAAKDAFHRGTGEEKAAAVAVLLALADDVERGKALTKVARNKLLRDIGEFVFYNTGDIPTHNELIRAVGLIMDSYEPKGEAMWSTVGALDRFLSSMPLDYKLARARALNDWDGFFGSDEDDRLLAGLEEAKSRESAAKAEAPKATTSHGKLTVRVEQ